MIRPIRGVLFDMDGVLVDSEKVLMRSAQEILQRWGIKADPPDFVPFIGAGEARFVGGAAEAHGVPYEPLMKQLTYERYAWRVAHTEIAMPGVHDTLRKLKENGLRIAVCSAADRFKVMVNIRALKLSPDFFTAVLSGEDAARKKPAPDIYLAGARALDLDPQDCVVVEDAVNGIQAGRAAGCRTIGVTTFFTREQLRQQAAPDWIAADTGAVANLILSAGQ